ncbi:probable linoleate 9S-lipoxygenase 5 [Tanacetum coccineum]
MWVENITNLLSVTAYVLGHFDEFSLFEIMSTIKQTPVSVVVIIMGRSSKREILLYFYLFWLDGLMDDGVKVSFLGMWMALFTIFTTRKLTQPIKDDIGDKSMHSANELFLGEIETPEWTTYNEAWEALKNFGANLRDIEKKINQMNLDKRLRNRTRPAQLPYTLLFPYSMMDKEGIDGEQDIMKAYKAANEEIDDSTNEHVPDGASLALINRTAISKRLNTHLGGWKFLDTVRADILSFIGFGALPFRVKVQNGRPVRVARTPRTENQYAIVAAERGMLADPKDLGGTKRFFYTIPKDIIGVDKDGILVYNKTFEKRLIS